MSRLRRVRLPVTLRLAPSMAARVGAAALLLSAAATGCAVAPNPASPSVAASSADGSARYESELAFCIDETNRLRATVAKPALARSAALETYAAAAARADGTARTPHQYALSTNHGNGLSAAENELLYWNLSFYKSVRNIIVQGLSQMWHQGEGGVHYANMTGPYREAGCGVFVNGDDVSVVQAFR